MSSSSHRSSRSRPPTSSPSAASRRPLVVIVGVVTIVLLALGVALSAGSGGGGDTTATGDDPVVDRGAGDDDAGGDGAGAGPTVTAVPDDTPATVEGTPLPPLPDAGADPAVGSTLPVLSGTGLDGTSVTIPTPEQATMVMFVAHWCPHCQAEVPVVQRWVDDGGLPSDVDLVAVSTAADARRPNHPPRAWLDGEGWTAPVLVDGDNSAAAAAGLTSYPFFVAVDAEGEVVARAGGALTADQLSTIADRLSEGPA